VYIYTRAHLHPLSPFTLEKEFFRPRSAFERPPVHLSPRLAVFDREKVRLARFGICQWRDISTYPYLTTVEGTPAARAKAEAAREDAEAAKTCGLSLSSKKLRALSPPKTNINHVKYDRCHILIYLHYFAH
jgi:hypothetical protein